MHTPRTVETRSKLIIAILLDAFGHPGPGHYLQPGCDLAQGAPLIGVVDRQLDRIYSTRS
jgi:hypothetical protein